MIFQVIGTVSNHGSLFFVINIFLKSNTCKYLFSVWSKVSSRYRQMPEVHYKLAKQ